MVSRKQLTFESDGKLMVADVLVPTRHKNMPFVLFLQGKGDDAEDNTEYARSLARRGFGSVIVRNIAGSEGHLKGAQAAYDALFELPESDATAIFAVGQSYGSYLAATLAASRPLAGVVLRAPAQLPDTNWHNQALASLHKSKVPVLVVSSEKDDPITLNAIKSYLAATTGPRAHRLIAGAGYDLKNKQGSQFGLILGEWLEARLELGYC